jgi:hypothetical protein
MKENGSMDSSMDLECGEAIEEIPTKANGNLANPRVMEYIHGLMEIHTKGNSKNASSMAKVSSDFQTEICTKEVT